MAAENRVSRIEECDCKKSCTTNGTKRNDGEVWYIDCDECRCEHGVVSCGLPKHCGIPPCKYPVIIQNDCCPRCLSKYIFIENTVKYYQTIF